MITPPDPRWQPQPMTPQQMSDSIAHLKTVVHWLVVLVILNVVLSAYVADFVHQIEQAIHQL